MNTVREYFSNIDPINILSRAGKAIGDAAESGLNSAKNLCSGIFGLPKKINEVATKNLAKVAVYPLIQFKTEEQIATQKEKIKQFTGSNHLSETSFVISHFAINWLEHHIKNPSWTNGENSNWAAKLFRNANDDSLNFTYQVIKNALSPPENKEKLRKIIELNILKVSANLSGKIKAISEDITSKDYEEGVFATTMTEILQDITKHFKTFNGTYNPDDLEKMDDSELNQKFLNAFADKKTLHPAIKQDNFKNSHEESKHLVENFFKEFSEHLFKIGLPNGSSDIAAPFGARGKVANIISKNILPNLSYDLYKLVMNPNTINKLLLSVFKKLNKQKKKNIATPKKDKSLKQKKEEKKLNKICKNLSIELLTFVDPTAAKALSRFPNFEKVLGEMAADLIRDYFGGDDFNLQELINNSIKLGIPTLYPGEWKKKEGDSSEVVFVPKSETKAPVEGKTTSKAQIANREFVYKFPSNKKEAKAEKEQNKIESEKVEKELISEIEKFGNKVIKKDFITALKNKSRILHGIFIFFKYLFYPITLLINYLISRRIKKKSQEVVEKIGLDIHKNLVIKILDVFQKNILSKQ